MSRNEIEKKKTKLVKDSRPNTLQLKE
jgi:hypothetical protein